MAPKYSICIPNYNSEAFIAWTIESALAQTVPEEEVEIIVSDNASSDNSLDIINRYLPRIRVIGRTKTLAAIEHWNACLSEATGKYAILLHSDDLIDPDFLEVCGDILDTRPGIQMVSAMTRIIDATGKVTKNQGRSLAQVKSVFDALIRGNMVAPPSLLVRRSFFQSSGYYNPSLIYAADYDLIIRGSENQGLLLLDRYLCGYRRHSANGGASGVTSLSDIAQSIMAFDLWSARYQLAPAQMSALHRQMVWGHLMMTIVVLERGDRPTARRRLAAIKANFPIWGRAAVLISALSLVVALPRGWRLLQLATTVYRNRQADRHSRNGF